MFFDDVGEMIPPSSSALLATFRANRARNVVPLFRPARANDGAQRVVFFRAPRHGGRGRAFTRARCGAVRREASSSSAVVPRAEVVNRQPSTRQRAPGARALEDGDGVSWVSIDVYGYTVHRQMSRVDAWRRRLDAP